MKTFKSKKEYGFTLIETIVYLALYAIVIGGVVAGIYAIFDSSGRNATKSMLEEEGIYLVGKIDWALTGASAASVPSSSQLSVNNSSVPASNNPLVFDMLGASMRLARGTASAQILNNTNVEITNVVFVYTKASGDGVVPESIKASFTLSARNPSGKISTQDFTTTKYLRK